MAFLSSSSTMDMNPSRAVTPTMTQAPHHGSNVPSEQESKDKKEEDFMKMRKVNQGMPTPYPPSDTTMPLYRPDAYASMGYYQHQAPQGHYGTQFNHQHQQWQVSQGQHPAHLINQQEQQLTAFQPSYQQQYSKHSQMQQHQLATFIPATPNQYSGNSETFVDLNNCASTNFSTEDTQADFNDRLVKSLLEYEPVKEVIQEMCKAAVEAALSDQNYCPPSPPPPAVKMMKFVSVKPRDGPQFDWEVPEEVYDDLIRIRMDQSMIKAVLMQLHPKKDLRHMLLTGEGRKNKDSTKLPERSITIVTASMIKYIWWKGEDFLKAPYKYPNEHKDYCQDIHSTMNPPKTAAPGHSHNNNNKAGSTKGPQMKDNTVEQNTKREASLGKRPATKTAVPTLASTRSKRTKAVKPQGSFSDFVGTSKDSQYDRSNDLPPHVDLLDNPDLW